MQYINQSLFDRMKRAAMLDSNLYEEVEHDLSATNQAATVVGIVAVANAISGLLGVILGAAIGGGNGIGWGIAGVFLGLIFAFVGWIVWSYLTYWVGTTVFKGTATPGEMLRTLGFAYTPNILGIVSFIPCLGALVGLAAMIWTIVAGVVAVRQALDIDTGQAVITVILAAIPLIFFWGFMAFIGIIGAAILS
ncbi:MAG: Yip1 family protein [Chloroflexota bacterium]